MKKKKTPRWAQVAAPAAPGSMTAAMYALGGVLDAELSPQGVVFVTREMLLQNPSNPDARNAMQRFCRYLEQHGYGDTADNILDTVLKLEYSAVIEWIAAAFENHIPNDTGLVNYIINGEEVKTW